jgi:hypothetical protein
MNARAGAADGARFRPHPPALVSIPKRDGDAAIARPVVLPEFVLGTSGGHQRTGPAHAPSPGQSHPMVHRRFWPSFPEDVGREIATSPPDSVIRPPRPRPLPLPLLAILLPLRRQQGGGEGVHRWVLVVHRAGAPLRRRPIPRAVRRVRPPPSSCDDDDDNDDSAPSSSPPPRDEGWWRARRCTRPSSECAAGEGAAGRHPPGTHSSRARLMIDQSTAPSARGPGRRRRREDGAAATVRMSYPPGLFIIGDLPGDGRPASLVGVPMPPPALS